MNNVAQEGPSSGDTVVCTRCGAENQAPGHRCLNCGRRIGRLPVWAQAQAAKRRWQLTRRRRVLLGAVIALLGLAAWSYYPFVPDPVILLFKKPTTELSSNSLRGQWTTVGRDLQLTRYIADVPQQPRGRVLWSQPLGEPTRSAPMVVDGVIYIGSHFKVLALDADTGQPVWEREITGPVHSTLAVAGDRLFLGLLDHRLVALDRATGETRWLLFPALSLRVLAGGRQGPWVLEAPVGAGLRPNF